MAYPALPSSWLWWRGESATAGPLQQEKRDQVLNFLEGDLENPAILAHVEDVLSGLMPEIVFACARLNVSLLPPSEDSKEGEVNPPPRPLEVLARIKTEYLNCVNGITFQNEQIGMLVREYKSLRDEIAVLKAERELARQCLALNSPTVHHQPCPDEFEGLWRDLSEKIGNKRKSVEEIKLDLADRLNRRRLKEERRVRMADELFRNLCGRLQLALVSNPTELSAGQDVLIGGNELDGGVRRRRGKGEEARLAKAPVFSDDEIKSMLKFND
jgi:hypothetical protein